MSNRTHPGQEMINECHYTGEMCHNTSMTGSLSGGEINENPQAFNFTVAALREIYTTFFHRSVLARIRVEPNLGTKDLCPTSSVSP